MARGLCLVPDMRPRFIAAPSVAVHSIMSLRSAHLQGDYEYMSGSVERPNACPLCGAKVYPPCDEFGPAANMEHGA